MKNGDKVLLINDIESVHMFPRKEEEPKQKLVNAGSLGIITEVFASGNGIVSFNGYRVLIMNLKEKTILA